MPLECICYLQVNMIPMGIENMIFVSESVIQRFKAQMAAFERQREVKPEKQQDRPRKVKSIDLLFDSYMRMLDNAVRQYLCLGLISLGISLSGLTLIALFVSLRATAQDTFTVQL